MERIDESISAAMRDVIGQRLERLKQSARQRHRRAEELAHKLLAEGRWKDVCPSPDGTACQGQLVVRVDGQRVEIPCPLAGKMCPPRRRALLIALGFGPRYSNPSLDRMLPVIREAVERYVSQLESNLHHGRGIWLAGPVGIGKTAALAYIAAAAWQPDRSILYRTAPELFDELAREGVTDVHRDCELLLLDDLGTEYDANWPLSRFGDLMDWRWRYMKAVCVTSNLMPAQLAQDERWQRVISRWRAMLTAYWQDGKDMRGRDDE